MNPAAADAARLFEVIGLNIALSGDNAVVVGMTVRNLGVVQRRIASAAGIWIAVVLQVAATLTVVQLLKLPMVSLAAGLLLGLIAIRLLRSDGVSAQALIPSTPHRGLLRSTAAVIGGFFIMSLDNILAVAVVGRGHPWLLIIGLLLSCVVIIPASLAIATLMRRYPITLTVGAGIIGWVAGSMLGALASPSPHFFSGPIGQFAIPAISAALVITSPVWWPGKHAKRQTG
jgi:YjbE family integral membrane protein